MAENPLVSDRFALAELDTAPEYWTALDKCDPADWALGLVEKRPSIVIVFFSNVRPKNIAIPGDACVIGTCDLPTPQRAWNEFKRTPPGTKCLTSDYGVLTLEGEAEHPQHATWPVGRRSPSLAQRFAVALKLHDTEDALDVIFDAVDSALLAGRFRECDRALASVSIDEWSIDLLIGLLSITLAASHKLPARAAFFERTRRVVNERGDDTPGLLDGLE